MLRIRTSRGRKMMMLMMMTLRRIMLRSMMMVMMLRMITLRRVMKRMIMLMLRKSRWRLMMLKMMRSRGRKMMMLRMMMLRTRTDPKTGNHSQANAADQDRGRTHFVRACAVEMHFNISREPLTTEMNRKNAAAQIEPRTRTHTLCEPAGSNCTSRQHFTRATLYGMNGKMTCPGLSPERGHTLTNL